MSMSATGILDTLIGSTSKFSGAMDENVEKIKRAFDEAVGIPKEFHDAVVRLLNDFEECNNVVEACNNSLKEFENGTDEYTQQIKNLEEQLSKIKSKKEKAEIREKIGKQKDLQSNAISTLAQRKESAKMGANVNVQTLQNKYGVKIADAQKANATMQKGLNAAGKGGKMAGATNALKSIKANPYMIAIDLMIKAVEFGIDKATEYMTLAFEKQMRAMQALTTATTNSMQANLSMWQDSLSGAYEAQNLAMSSNLALIEAENANALAATKLTNTWTNWIPVVGSLNKKEEERMRLQNEVQQLELKNAMEIIKVGEGYAKQVDTYLKQQDQAIHDYTRSVGLSVEQTHSFETRMIALNKSLASVGRTAEDVLKIQATAQEQSGRIINYSDEDYKSLGAIGKVMGDNTVAKFLSETVIFNQSVESSAAIMTDMYNYANRMGLSQKKLTQSVLANIKTANKYQFKGGLKGFIDFNKWAENVRFNVAQLGNMIEKIQTGGLEGIIKQAAQVQVLGGNFAMHADPLRMAYNAFMDPEELAKDFYDSLKAEGVFDTKTGELYQGIGNQIRVRQYAEAMGYSFEDTKTMLRERTKRENIGKQLQNSGLTEEQIQAVANGAQRDENGNWYVNTIGGNRVNVSDIGQNFDVGSILSNNQDEKMAQYAEKTLSATERIAATTQYISALLGGASLDMFNETIDKSNELLKNGFEENLDSVYEGLSLVYGENVEAVKAQVAQLGTMGTEMAKAYDVQHQAATSAKTIEEMLRAQYGKDINEYEAKEATKAADEAYKNYEEAKKTGDEKEIAKARDALNEALKKKAKATGDYSTLNILEQKKSRAEGWGAGGGAAAGALIGAGIGSIIPGVGTAIGAGVGAIIGGVGGALGGKAIAGENYRESDYLDNIIEAQYGTKKADDATIASGSSVVIPSSKVTPINDGTTEFAKTNPNDSAIFAKTGGPFDKLFDDIFGRIDAVYNAVMPRAKETKEFKTLQNIRNYASSVFSNPIANNVRSMMARPIGSDMVGTVREYSGATGGDIAQTNTNTSIDFKPIRLEINGRLDIAGGGANMNIMQELKKDPFFIRSLTQLISNSLSEKVNGGKALYNGGNLTYL